MLKGIETGGLLRCLMEIVNRKNNHDSWKITSGERKKDNINQLYFKEGLIVQSDFMNIHLY